MLITYLSLTGNIRNFVDRLGMDAIELDYSNPLVSVDEDYIVISPSYDDEITNIISRFINYRNNINHLIGFVGSGNKNFDEGFCFNARDLSRKYGKPLLYTFEFSGTDDDVENFKKEVDNIEVT